MKSTTGKKKYLGNICSFSGITVIEMLAAVAIILLLIGFGVPAYNSWRNRANIADAQAAVAKIGMALEMYKTDFGFYPQVSGGDLDLNGTAQVVNSCLLTQITIGSDTYGPYLKHPGEEMAGNRMVDRWGNYYVVFTAPGSSASPDFTLNKNTFYIYSFGPDGAQGTVDDITSFGN